MYKIHIYYCQYNIVLYYIGALIVESILLENNWKPGTYTIFFGSIRIFLFIIIMIMLSNAYFGKIFICYDCDNINPYVNYSNNNDVGSTHYTPTHHNFLHNGFSSHKSTFYSRTKSKPKSKPRSRPRLKPKPKPKPKSYGGRGGR